MTISRFSNLKPIQYESTEYVDYSGKLVQLPAKQKFTTYTTGASDQVLNVSLRVGGFFKFSLYCENDLIVNTGDIIGQTEAFKRSLVGEHERYMLIERNIKESSQH